MSNCQSFGSNYHPSSQSRKISIGITVDSLAKKNSGATKEDGVKILNAEKMNLNKENSMEAQNKGEGDTAGTKAKQSEATEQVSSPWITTRSFFQNSPMSDTVLCTKQASGKPNTGGRQRKLNGVRDTQKSHLVHFFADQNSFLESGGSVQKKFSGITYERKGGKNESQEQVEEFTFANAQETIVSNKVVITDKTDETENRRTETLRMKLWQILGTVSSPKSQSQAHEIGANKLKPVQVVDQIDTVVRPRQNSDTIETDSENPNQPTSRPLTRSLTRKRASTKVRQSKTKICPSSSCRQKHQKNIFSFEEGWSGKLDGATNFGSLMSTRKKSQRKSCKIEPRKISFSEKDNEDQPQRARNNSASPTPAEKTSSLGHKVDSLHGCPPEDMRDCFDTNNRIQEKDFGPSSESKKMNQRDDRQASTENRDPQKDCSNPSLQNVGEPPDEFQSPTFAFKTPILSPSPCSTPRTVQIEQDVRSPVLECRRFSGGSIRSFRTLQTSKEDCSGSYAEMESPGNAEKLQDFSPRNPSPVKEKNDTEDDLAEFSSDDGDPESFEDGSSVIKEYDRRRETSPETCTADKPNSMLCPTNRLCNHGGIRVDEFSPSLPSPKGIGENDWFQEHSEQSQEDELARAVTMFAFYLENFRRKMNSAAKKKSSDILMSVSEGIHLQLQNVESQIQTDIGKLTSLSKSKRKRLETRFEVQQEQLKLTHQKFKKDIHRHLQDCQSTLEVLEAHQIELKGTMKKQRTSHQKLFLQLEEAVDTQLNDAQRRITTVHELAREKMLQLKQVIAECLKEESQLSPRSLILKNMKQQKIICLKKNRQKNRGHVNHTGSREVRAFRTKENPESTMTSLQSANLASMSDKEFYELVWEDGQLLKRGFPKRTPKNPSCAGHSSHPSGGDHLKNGGDSTFPPKSARFGAVDSILDDLRHDKKKDFYQNFTQNSSLLYDKYNESPPELYQRHFNEFSELDRGNSYDKLLKDSQVVPENEYANLKPGYASNHLSTQPEQFTLQKYLASAPLKRPRTSHNPASLGVLPSSKLQEQDLEPERKRETVNFSLFLRSPAMATRSRGFSRDEELKSNGKTSGPRNDKPFESASIAPDATASKTVKGFQNQLNLVENNADLLQPISKPPVKSLPDVQSEAVCRENGFKYKRSPDRQVNGQPSSLPANTVKGKPNTEKYIEPPVASSSFCSRGASNNPTYTLKRRYVETDGSACPSDENVEEKPVNVKKALPARGSKGNRKRRFAEVHNLSERKRRDKINKKMSALQELIPNCNKVDKASMLDEAIDYLKSLQLQVQMMLMGTGVCRPPPMMLPTGMQQLHAPQMTHFSPMGHFGMGMRMQMGVGCVPPHFLIPPILGATAVPGLAETRIQMPAGFPGQPLPMSSMFRSPFELMHKTIPIAGVSGPTPSTELMDSAPLTISKDSIHNLQVNNQNVHRSKIQPSGLPLRND